MMSSSITTIPNTSNGLLSSGVNASTTQFREIHKNTWLKRLTAEGRKVPVGPKKSDRSWVVFCVHDDTDALLEGYAEPRQAASHSPEWIVSMQDTLHISHALIPNSHEFEFVITFSSDVVRFHASSWEIMQEWVETLRIKLREMKILSPRENLYTKLPEIRAPLLPTRDPTSPLPAPPPVPAAFVPGVERVATQSVLQEAASTAEESAEPLPSASTSNLSTDESIFVVVDVSNSYDMTKTASNQLDNVTSSIVYQPISANSPALSTMSNTRTQNLLNMLTDPISVYSEQLNESNAATTATIGLATNNDSFTNKSTSEVDVNVLTDSNTVSVYDDHYQLQLLRNNNCLSNATCSRESENSSPDNSIRLEIADGYRKSADEIKNTESLFQCERLIPRPQTYRSLSAGASDKSRKLKSDNDFSTTQSKKHETKFSTPNAAVSIEQHDNITALKISTETTNIKNIASTQTDRVVKTITNESTNADNKTNITIIQVSTNTKKNNDDINESPPKLPVKNITSEIFKFPDTGATTSTAHVKSKQNDYKSNVQIIPSNLNSSTIQILGENTMALKPSNQYSSPMKKSFHSMSNNMKMHIDTQKVTTVHLSGSACNTNTPAAALSSSVYGTCYTAVTQPILHSIPKLPEKIILSANTSGVTNISVNNNHTNNSSNLGLDASLNKEGKSNLNARDNINMHYEKVFLSTSEPISIQQSTTPSKSLQNQNINILSTTKVTTSHTQSSIQGNGVENINTEKFSDVSQLTQVNCNKQKRVTHSCSSSKNSEYVPPAVVCHGSPVLAHRRLVSHTRASGSPSSNLLIDESQPQSYMRPQLLKRGLTEAIITARPSRKDFHFMRLTSVKTKSDKSNGKGSSLSTNNNDEIVTSSMSYTNEQQPLPHANIHRTNSEVERKRSSSTSDAHTQNNRRNTNNNEHAGNRGNANNASSMQLPPQLFHSVENELTVGRVKTPPNTMSCLSATKQVNLREQQVMQLRREIMHPGGVRLQLRRKDCVGSIAWVDAFGAVWVSGWKQKEHPVLYNALHIGDQLLSIAGIAANSAAEANKIIRNSNTLFVEVLVRRLPFGRGYAIRREREGQCLGLIRDGNTATIVDVVPNSLAARHGLPPKAQSFDGTTLTFWILTEINGRPLNLFFKDYEIRDRLNSVGRDISILVQPSDLITKLKKQLKSLRSYKDYLVQ